MKKILIPVKESDEEKNIIDEAILLAKKFDSEITLLNVSDCDYILDKKGYGNFIKNDKLCEKEIDNSFLYEYEKLYKEAGVKTKILVLDGDPAATIIDEASKYDLAIMKTHTLKERSRFTLGSVTNKVVHHIKIPILVVR